MKLYSFFRSGTSHRLRIALNLKGLSYEYAAVDLRVGNNLKEDFVRINPQGLVPVLSCDGAMMTQSPSIIEWLEERYPHPPLLPKALDSRARVRALAAIIGCDIHPLNNKRVLEELRNEFRADEIKVKLWCARWIRAGFDALERMLSEDSERGDFCFGGTPTIADVYLVPQVESARRFGIDVGAWPKINAIDAACGRLSAFQSAAPARQPDAVE